MSDRLTLEAPSRLHFGLLGWGSDRSRQFGGVGLMVRDPGLRIVAYPSDRWDASGPMAARVQDALARVVPRIEADAALAGPIPPARLRVERAPSEHVGLGLGTQVGLAVARLVDRRAGLPDRPVAELARTAGRGLRSGVGLHGFGLGGLIVDGGRATAGAVEGAAPPLLARMAFPEDWSTLLVIPRTEAGLHGDAERRAFADLPPFPEALTDRLCRLLLLGLLPAVAERDLDAFGSALEEIQREVGGAFAPAQGGTFASAEAPAILATMRELGLRGVGQSSWGPTLYGFAAELDEAARDALLGRFQQRFHLIHAKAYWTRAQNTGASVEVG